MNDTRAVMFDIGGVVVTSPLISIFDYERRLGLPPNWLNVQITRRGSDGAWQRFERGEMPLHDFYKAFGEELSDTVNGNSWYKEFCDKKHTRYPPLPTKLCIDGRQLFGRMMRESVYDPVVVEAIRRIRAAGKWKILALTNNFTEPLNAIKRMPATDAFSPQAELEFLGWAGDNGPANSYLKAMFDDFIDSSTVGKRKPEPDFYLHACEKHELKPQEIIFLDDLGMNLKAAKGLGMDTIHVQIGNSREAIKILSEKLGIELLEELPPSSKL